MENNKNKNVETHEKRKNRFGPQHTTHEIINSKRKGKKSKQSIGTGRKRARRIREKKKKEETMPAK